MLLNSFLYGSHSHFRTSRITAICLLLTYEWDLLFDVEFNNIAPTKPFAAHWICLSFVATIYSAVNASLSRLSRARIIIHDDHSSLYINLRRFTRAINLGR